MFSYLALVWHVEDPASRETARRLIERHDAQTPDWRTVVRGNGLYVGCTGIRPGASEPYTLHGGAGAILGTLFERPSNDQSAAAPRILDAARTDAILRTRGRDLVERYWGRYVAFLHDGPEATSRILRDPSGGLPCLSVRFGGVRLFFSAMHVIQHLGLGPFDVDWGYLAASVCLMRGHTSATALRGVSHVLGGECVTLRENRATSTFYWDALQIAASNPIEDPVDAARQLRDRVMDSVRAWASCYDGILLSLSGGLDSSIVYAALRDTPAKERLTCFHYYPTGSDMDERHFARDVARSGGSALLERPRDSALSLEPLLGVEASHEPANYLYYLEHSRLDAELAAERGASAAFIGWGGDQLFYQERAAFAAGDYLQRRGLRPRLFRVALAAAQMDRVSVWQVLRAAFVQQRLQYRWSLRAEVAKYRPLIRPEVLDEVYGSDLYVHPLLSDARGTASGKLWHAFQLSTPWEFYDPLGRPDDPERVAPLYSQQVIELCLRIPVDVLTQGGWDRAIARRAFHRELPRGVANRREKGGIEWHVRGILEHNAAFVRELLLDGELVRAGVVDRPKLATALSGKASPLRPSIGELLDFLGIEAWLRRWRNQGWRAAA
ncbi:MAG TPA: asparagine synthase C-terminal domain-containing protein [Steroidobacteraceae bacterium]|nr:asparagine synthase C-terminal domain-containing protein [Steroidobacteraceae bacterium]